MDWTGQDTNWIEFYNPSPLIVTDMTIYDGNQQVRNWEFQCSDDNENWTTLTSGTNTNTTAGNSWNFSVSNSGSHKYYRLLATSTESTDGYISFAEIEITASVTGGTWTKLNI